ncbi:MAG: uroporphyrinogen-III synthase [Luteimonas sp.]
MNSSAIPVKLAAAARRDQANPMSRDASATVLSGCYVISLRPVGGHAALRRAAAAKGAGLLALSPWRLAFRADLVTRGALKAALLAPRVIFTSPSAVRAAQALQPLRLWHGQEIYAVGGGTARALHRAGITQVEVPARMDSEGLLSLPGLKRTRATQVGLVTAPGGRGRIATVLKRRGADVVRADVYERVVLRPAPRAVARLRALEVPLLLALSSGEALERVLASLPADAAARLRTARVLAASQRLAELARWHGFDDIVLADNARPSALLAAAALFARGEPSPSNARAVGSTAREKP